jgi:hypothetical protein
MAVTNTNQYTRFMVEKYSDLDQIIAPTAFQGSFFGVAETGAKTHFIQNKKNVEIDIQRNNGRRLAQMVHRGTATTDDTRVKKTVASRFSNVAFAWPLIESKGGIDSATLLDRVAGKNPYEDQSVQDNLAEKAMEIHHSHFNEQISTAEYLARESVFFGAHPAILGTTNTGYIYDFGRNTDNNITVGTVWTDPSAGILADLDSAIDKVQQNGNIYDAEYGFLMDSAAFGGLKKNTEIKADADNRRYSFVTLGGDQKVPPKFSRYVKNGFAPRGWVETVKGRTVWLFTYDLTFTDDFTNPGTDTETPWVPAGKGLLFHPKTRCDKYVGPMDRLPFTPSELKYMQERFGFKMGVPSRVQIQNPSIIDPRMFYTWSADGADMKAIEMTTQSSLILPTTRTDGFALLEGLV